MNKFCVTFLVVLIIVLHGTISAQKLDDNLKILEPLLEKTWTGELKSPDGSKSWTTSQNYNLMWDGMTVKYSSSTPDNESFSEGYFYWDREEKKIAVIMFNSRGIYNKGFVTIEDGLLSISGTISFPERTFQFRNTFEFTEDGKMIDRWFQNAFGSWRPGHVIHFNAEN